MEIDRNEKFRLAIEVSHSIPTGDGEPTIYITEITGDLLTWIPADFDEMKAGSLVAYKYHIFEAHQAGVDPFDVFDAHSQDSLNVFSAVMEMEGGICADAGEVWRDVDEIFSLLYVSQVTIDTPFQGRGFERDAIEALGQVFGDAVAPFVVDAEGLANNGLSGQAIHQLLRENTFERIGSTSYYTRSL